MIKKLKKIETESGKRVYFIDLDWLLVKDFKCWIFLNHIKKDLTALGLLTNSKKNTVSFVENRNLNPLHYNSRKHWLEMFELYHQSICTH